MIANGRDLAGLSRGCITNRLTGLCAKGHKISVWIVQNSRAGTRQGVGVILVPGGAIA